MLLLRIEELIPDGGAVGVPTGGGVNNCGDKEVVFPGGAGET